jgi:cysteine synthase
MWEAIVPEIYTTKYFDKIETALTSESYKATKELIRDKGLLVGISSGAVYSVVKRYLEKEDKEEKEKEIGGEEKKAENYLMIFPDRFERYASISF